LMPGLIPAVEVLALQHPSDGHLPGQADDVLERELAEPLGVAADLETLPIEDLEHLLQVRRRVRIHLLGAELRAGRGSATRVADARGEVSDDQHRLVPQVLELTQLRQGHRVPEVDVGGRGVEPELHAERASLRETRSQRPVRVDLLRVAGQQCGLLGGGHAVTRSRTREIPVARPVVSSTSMIAPWTSTGPSATSNRTGIWLRKRCST